MLALERTKCREHVNNYTWDYFPEQVVHILLTPHPFCLQFSTISYQTNPKPHFKHSKSMSSELSAAAQEGDPSVAIASSLKPLAQDATAAKKKTSWRLAVFKKDTKVRPKPSFCWYKNPQCAHSRSIEGGCGPSSSRRAWWSYRGARGGQGPAAFIRSYQKAWDSLFSLEKRLRRILLRFARFWRQ